MAENEILNEEEMVEDDGIITMVDQDGNSVEFEYLDVIEYEGAEYAVLMPLDDEEDGMLVIFKIEAIEDNDEEENYIAVEDEKILGEVFEAFKEKHKDEYNFAD